MRTGCALRRYTRLNGWLGHISFNCCFFAYPATPIAGVVAGSPMNYCVVITGANNATVTYTALDTLERSSVNFKKINEHIYNRQL